MAKKKEGKFESASGVLFVGAMFIGMGLGFYFNQLVVGLMAGMGVGFLLMGLTILADKAKN